MAKLKIDASVNDSKIDALIKKISVLKERIQELRTVMSTMDAKDPSINIPFEEYKEARVQIKEYMEEIRKLKQEQYDQAKAAKEAVDKQQREIDNLIKKYEELQRKIKDGGGIKPPKGPKSYTEDQITQALNTQVQSIKEAREQLKILRFAQSNVTDQQEKETGLRTKLNIKIKENTDYLRLNSDAYVRQKMEIGNYEENIKRAINGNNNFSISFGKILAVVGGASAIKGLISDMVQIRGEFQATSIAFETMLGSKEQADALMQQMIETASKTPFDLQSVSQGAKQLLAYGTSADQVNDTLVRLGNIASGLSIPLNDLIYLYGTTMSQGRLFTQDLNQFMGRGIPLVKELSTELGKTDKEIRQMVTEGKIGFPEVQKAIENLTNEGGKFYNLMEMQSKTLSGQVSNLKDAWGNMLNAIGEDTEQVASKLLSGAGVLIENYEKIGKILASLIAVYGTYKTALVVTTIAQDTLTARMQLAIVVAKAQAVAMAALNAISKANPYVLLATAIAGVAAAMWVMRDSTSATEKIMKSATEKMKVMEESSNRLRSKIDGLLNIIRDETSTQYDKAKAYKQLQSIMPEVFSNMDTEKLKLIDILSLNKQIREELNRRELIGAKTNVVLAQKRYDIASKKYQNQIEKGLIGAGALAEKNEAFIELESAKKVVAEIEDIQSKAIAQKKENNKVDVVQNKEYWENKKKEAETARNALDVSKKNSEEWNKYTKQIQEAQKQIDKYSSSNKQGSDANKLLKQQEGIRSQNDKISEIERKQAIQRKRQTEDMEMEISQSEINAMAEGAEKKRMQRELDNRKEIQSLERQKQDMIQAVIQAEKEIFDAQEELKAKENNKYQKKTFDSSKVDTGKISSIWDTIIENTSRKQLDDKIRDQEAAWNEYLIKFGNYQQKRLAIIEKYDKAIKEAETAGDAAILMKEKANALDDFDNSVKNSTTLMGQLFADASQKSVNEIQSIIAKAELLMQYLGAVKDEQGNAKIGGKTVSKKDILGLGISDNTLQNLELSTDQVEALRDAIDRLKGELGGKSPFKLFETQVKQARDKIAQGGKKNIVQGVSEIGNAIVQFAPAISQFGQDLGTIFGNDDLGNKIAGISDALGGVGQTAMGVGQIMSGDIVGGAMSAVSGISSVVKALDGLFGADYSRYNEMKSQYEALNSVWDELINKKKEYIDMSYGDEAYKVGKEAESLIKQQTQRYYELLNELRKSGSSIGSSSLGKRIEKRLNKEDWARISSAVGESVTNAETLLNLSAEQLEEVLADPKIVSVLNTVNEDFIKYIQDIVNGSEKLEDIQNQVKEQLTQVSFDSVFDSFVDTLMNMDSSAKDFADDFTSYMQKAILSTMLGKTYESRLQAWYDAFASANEDKGGISSDEYKKLQEQWNGIVNDAIKERNELKDLLGWSSGTSASQDSTKRGFETMSQDTAEELNGRFTALQMAGEEIKGQTQEQTRALNLANATASQILAIHVNVRDIADESRNFIVQSYMELQGIHDDTSAMVKPIKNMANDIAEIKRNTRNT